MNLVNLSDASFEEVVVKSEKPVLVDFFADWCGPCRAVAPIVEEIAIQFEGKMVVGKLDVDASSVTAGKYGVQSIPTVILFDKGEEVGRQVGYGGKEGYLDLIKKVIK